MTGAIGSCKLQRKNICLMSEGYYYCMAVLHRRLTLYDPIEVFKFTVVARLSTQLESVIRVRGCASPTRRALTLGTESRRGISSASQGKTRFFHNTEFYLPIVSPRMSDD
jgi:hypothetical protein